MNLSLLRAQGGNVAVLFSLLTFPLLAGVGLALEFSNISAHRSKLQNAVDSAVLFAGKYLIANDSLPSQSDIEGFVYSNYDGPFSLVEIDQSSGQLSITVDATVPAYFFGDIYPDAFHQEVSASVPYGGKSYLEIALVLDSTHSMSNEGKMTALKAVADGFVDKMISAADASNDVRIGLVPYASYVNVGTANRYASWIGYTPRFWRGCVGSRRAPDTLRDGAIAVQFPGVRKWLECPSPIVGLTRSKAVLKSGISSMNPGGYTYIADGVMWGLRVLTERAPFTDAKRFGSLPTTTSHKKIMLVLTDGENTIAPGLPETTDHSLKGDEGMRIGDENTRIACEVARDEGVLIFAVAFGDDVADRGRSVMTDCAGSVDRFYVANDASELQGVFDSIRSKIVTLRLTS